MARVTHVKRAQQLFHTKPVIDPETGEQKQTPVINKRTGEQKVTKHGRPVFLKVTVADKDRPKPNLRCDFPGCEFPDREIKPGQSYKHITPKSGPYGGTQRSRHEEHPTWNVWEYSSSLSARIAEIESHFDPTGYESPEELQDHLNEIAEEIEALAEEKREAASNIEDGFGHETSASEELNGQAEALENWAEEVKSLDIPEMPEPEPVYKWFVNGPEAQSLNEEGYEDEDEAQRAMEVYLEENPEEDEDDWSIDSEESDEESDEPTEEQISAWQDEVSGLELGDPGV